MIDREMIEKNFRAAEYYKKKWWHLLIFFLLFVLIIIWQRHEEKRFAHGPIISASVLVASLLFWRIYRMTNLVVRVSSRLGKIVFQIRTQYFVEYRFLGFTFRQPTYGLGFFTYGYQWTIPFFAGLISLVPLLGWLFVAYMQGKINDAWLELYLDFTTSRAAGDQDVGERL